MLFCLGLKGWWAAKRDQPKCIARSTSSDGKGASTIASVIQIFVENARANLPSVSVSQMGHAEAISGSSHAQARQVSFS
jgi:hypothetical protein